jgi:hypothetical protein
MNTCLDVIQTFIDKYAQVCLIKVMGDFNAQLPRTVHLCRNWQRAKGFNSHSLLLHDFIMANNLLLWILHSSKVYNTRISVLNAIFLPGLIMP